MGKAGGPCQGPGDLPNTICGATMITDKSSWRVGGKFKPEHAGKPCCTKRPCRIFLGVIEDTKAVAAAAADAALATAAAAPSPPPPTPPPPHTVQPPPPQPPQPIIPAPTSFGIPITVSPVAAAPVAAKTGARMSMKEMLERIERYPKLAAIIRQITERKDYSDAQKMAAVDAVMCGEQPPPRPPPPPPWLGDATLHLGLPYGLIPPPIPPPILPPSAAATAADTDTTSPPSAATDATAATAATVQMPAAANATTVALAELPSAATANRLLEDDDSDGWRSEDDNEEDIFSELAMLLTSTERPKLSVVTDTFQTARSRYEDEREAHEQTVKNLQTRIRILQEALGLTLTSDQNAALKKASGQIIWAKTSPQEAKAIMQAELACAPHSDAIVLNETA